MPRYLSKLLLSILLVAVIALRVSLFLKMIANEDSRKDLNVPVSEYTTTPSGRGYAFDPHDYLLLADRISAGNGYTYEDGKITTFRPPLYPFFLSLLNPGFPHSSSAPLWANFIMSTISICLLTIFFKKHFSIAMALIICPILAINEAWIWSDSHIQYESLLIFLLSLGLLIVNNINGANTLLYATMTGIFLGLSSLANPSIIVAILIFVILLIALRIPKPTAVLVLFCSLGTILPWTLRNVLATGSFVMISSNGGMNLYIGNTQEDIDRSGKIYNSEILKEIQRGDHQGDEIAIDRTFYRKAFEYINEYPLIFFTKSVKKLLIFVYTISNMLSNGLLGKCFLAIVFIIIMAIVGIVRVFKENRAGGILALSLVLSGCVVYSTHWFWLRMLLPYFPSWGILVSYGLVGTARGLMHRLSDFSRSYR